MAVQPPTKIPAYAKVKTITSLSGAKAVGKHIVTLRRAQLILAVQGDEASLAAARAITATIDGYRRELAIFYTSEHYPYRVPA